MDLDITYEQYKKLSTTQKLDVLYFNQTKTLDAINTFNSIKKKQNLLIATLSALWGATGFIFYSLWKHVGGN